MGTLVCSTKPPVIIHRSFPSRLPNLHPISIRTHPARTQSKLHANAKGFSGSQPAAAKEKKAAATGGGGDDDDEIPQAVFERMIVRIVVSVGVPLAAGIGLLNLFGVIKEQQLWDVPMWVPFMTTLLCFGTSALGIAYGTLSTSWDPDRDGSVLGLEEAQKNWVEMWKEEIDS